MAELTLNDIFGSAVSIEYGDPIADPGGQDPGGDPGATIADLRFWLGSFGNSDDVGEIEGGLGFNAPFLINPANADSYATKILYGILLFTKQNQAANINDDPEQKVFIAEQAPRLAVGSRTGQVQRSFLVSFFTAENISSIPDIDDI